MKKLTCAFLALAMLAGLSGFMNVCAAAGDLGFTELLLNTPITVSSDSNGSAGPLAFYPAQTGWYIFEGTSPGESTFLIFTVQLHENGTVSEVHPPIANSANTILLNGSGAPVSTITRGRRNSGMKSLYLESGKSYSVEVRALTGSSAGVAATFQVAVLAANSVTGRGTVNARNIELASAGAIAAAEEIFASPPPYGVLRVSIQGDAVGADLVAKKAGVSTLVFYDLAGNEVGRSTVTVLSWWQRLPVFLQVLLRWFVFGWLWM